ncbi:MAG TPA: sugar phosphate nucleotidyltransferase [Candidatus Binatia bacterium]|jgi:mannose-1-phosphate guanylyltransferase|nr:sugar phosphate nucleotidyltransferase [Candidatus Binatia bacterium]
MKAIILAGGGGTRLWPVSRKTTPKQVEPIIGEKSLLRATYDRVRKGFRPEDIYVATAESQADVVRAQLIELPEENLILEPCRRETAAAIGYALLRIAAKDPRATFVTVNSDAYVRDVEEYQRVLRAAEKAVESDPTQTVLVGITPSYPETGYGYIKTGPEALRVEVSGHSYGVDAVERFVEKPDLPTARQYLAEGGYLWNPTLIVGRVDTFLGLYKKHLPTHALYFERMAEAFGTDDEDEAVRSHFARIPAISIDYGILEKEERMRVLPADFGWADVGNWRTVRDILAAEPEENVVKGRHVGVESNGNLIYGFSGKLIATAGVNDMIIIETIDAVLVCSKDRAQDVKRIVGQLEDDLELQKYL